MKKHLILGFAALAMLMGIASCSDDKDKSIPTIPIKEVKTSANVDLTKRADWKFYVGLMEYNYTVKGYDLIATPKSEKETWYVGDHGVDGYGGYGGYGSNNYMGSLLVTSLLSPNYHAKPAEAKDVPAQTIKDQLDQSTPAKMLEGDALTSWYKTVSSENVEGVQLNHEHCLVQYTFVDLPKDATMKLTSESFEIAPLVEEGVTKAILTDLSNNKIVVKIDEVTYSVSLDKALEALIKGSTEEVRNQHYTFEVKLDDSATDNIKKLIIQNLKVTKWSMLDEGPADK